MEEKSKKRTTAKIYLEEDFWRKATQREKKAHNKTRIELLDTKIRIAEAEIEKLKLEKEIIENARGYLVNDDPVCPKCYLEHVMELHVTGIISLGTDEPYNCYKCGSDL